MRAEWLVALVALAMGGLDPGQDTQGSEEAWRRELERLEAEEQRLAALAQRLRGDGKVLLEEILGDFEPSPTSEEEIEAETKRLEELRLLLDSAEQAAREAREQALLAEVDQGPEPAQPGTTDQGAEPRPADEPPEATGVGAPADSRPAPVEPIPERYLARMSPLSRIRVADLLYDLDRTEEALALYRAVSGAGSEAAGLRDWALHQEGRCLERLGRRGEAARVYRTLTGSHPESEWARHAAWSLEYLAWMEEIEALGVPVPGARTE